MGWARAQGTTGISGFAAPQGEGHGFDPAQGCEGMWLPTYLGSSLAAWYKADAGCYTDAACLFASASSQYLSKTSPTFAPTTKMTIRMSWKPASVGGFMALAAQYSSGTDGFILWQRNTGVLWLALYGASDKYVQGTTVLTAGVQYEIVVVYDGTQALGSRGKIFINGVEETYASDDLPASYVASSAALCVGGNSTGGFYADGALARLGFSSLALSGAALTAAHTSTFWADMTAARQADWFSFYNLCEASSTRVDSTGLNNLTPTNGPTVAAGPGEGLAVNNSPVKRWEDQSGNARHLTQSDITKQPLWIAAAQNGRSIVRGDGTDDFIQATFALAQPNDVYFVGRSQTMTGNASILDSKTPNLLDIRVRVDSAAYTCYAGNFGPELTPSPLTTFRSFRWLFNGASSLASYDNSADATGDAGTGPTDGLTLFANGNGATNTDSEFGEVFIATAAVAVPTNPKAYLRQRWATP